MRVKRLRLRCRIALPCLAATLVAIVLTQVLGTTSAGALGYSPSVLAEAVDRTAADSALTVAREGDDRQLAPGQLRQLGHLADAEGTPTPLLTDRRHLIVPIFDGIRDPAGPVPAELAVDNAGTVVITSYESRYPVGGDLGILVPQAAARLPDVLHGSSAHGVAPSNGGTVDWAMYPVVSATGAPRGAVYVQVGLADAPIPPLVVPALTGVLAAVALTLAACALLGMREAAADHARVAERDRIARELHDSISQELFAVRMTVSALEARHTEDVALSAQLRQVGQSLAVATRQTRALLLELRPPRAAGLDLASALRDLAASYRSRVGVVVDARVEPIDLPGSVRDGLLRIAQETLANAARHSGADRIEVTLRRGKGAVELRVTDNGRGFAPDSGAARLGLGLRLLEERAAELRATLEVDSAPDRGTLVLVTIPR